MSVEQICAMQSGGIGSEIEKMTCSADVQREEIDIGDFILTWDIFHSWQGLCVELSSEGVQLYDCVIAFHDDDIIDDCDDDRK